MRLYHLVFKYGSSKSCFLFFKHEFGKFVEKKKNQNNNYKKAKCCTRNCTFLQTNSRFGMLTVANGWIFYSFSRAANGASTEMMLYGIPLHD